MKTLNTIKLLSVLLLATAALQSCTRNDLVCVRGNGAVQSETRILGDFDAIASSGNFDVTIVQGNGPLAEVTAERNLLQHIETRIDRGTLQLNTVDNQCISPTERVRITIYTPSLSGVLQNGSGDIVCDSLSTTLLNAELTGSGSIDMRVLADAVTARVSGSGQMYLEGAAPNAQLTVSGSGTLDALDMPTQIADVSLRGTGDIFVHCDSVLNVEITGSGDVWYTGDPEVDSRITGSGNLKLY